MKLSKEFIIFLFVGGFATFVNFLSRIILNLILEYNVSVILAAFIGLTTSYFLNKKVVFKSNANVVSSFIKFTLINFLAIAEIYFVSVYLNIFLQNHEILYSELIAHCVGLCVPIITSYLGYKYFSFK